MITALKTLGLFAPALLYLGVTSLSWRGRLFGPAARSGFAAMGMLVVATVACTVAAAAVGAGAYELGPGRSCRELGCLQALVWMGIGGLIGLPVGAVLGWRLRSLARANCLAYHAPAVVTLLGTLAAAIFNDDMLR